MDAEKNKKYFSESSGKKGFSFAIGKDLYVPKIANERRMELENWFGGLENTLARTIKKIKSEANKPLFESPMEMNKFVLALFSFKHRTKFVIEKNKELLSSNPYLKDQISGEADRDADLVILENIVNATTADYIRFPRFELVVMESKGDSLIYGDMPFLEEIVDGFNFLPVTNKIFLAFRKINEASFYYYETCEDELVDSLNFSIASNSVNWIIADNVQQINKYEDSFKENIDVSSKFVPIEFPIRGYLFKNT